jgi:tRNA/tmRNA/rRNA uracil-C5-methylase (TrmA/RlmC/RlmD family)
MTTDGGLARGDVVDVEITAIAHGGVCVGRHDGQVLFVRHCLPGERVRARVIDAPKHGRFVRADAEAILRPSVDRVTPPCPYAGVCGGCDWQHVSMTAQRALKATVIREQLTRLGGEPPERWIDLQVEAVPGDVDGLGWRTRMRYAVDRQGRAGLRRHRSHEVVPVDTCLLATPAIRDLQVTRREWPGVREVLAVSPSLGTPLAMGDPQPGRARIVEAVEERLWRLDATAFWQVHPGAAETFTRTVAEFLQPRTGEHLLDLYAGAGLFAGMLADAIGESGRIDAVEPDPVAMRAAKRSLHDIPQIHLHETTTFRWLRSTVVTACDLVVLDPPRTGAGTRVMASIMAMNPRAIAYVACDPAALARDIASAKKAGWTLAELRAFDAFPMTHHVECIALLTPPQAER